MSKGEKAIKRFVSKANKKTATAKNAIAAWCKIQHTLVVFFSLFPANEHKYCIEGGYVYKEQQNYYKRIKHRIATNEIVKDVVRSSVATHKEHIVVWNKHVGYVRRYAEEGEDP